MEQLIFFVAQDFVDFVRRHGTEVNNKFEIFRISGHEEEYHRSGRQRVPYETYQALTRLHDRVFKAIFSTKPEAPRGWSHTLNRMIIQEASTKRDLLDALEEIGVDAAQRKTFGKVKVSQLQEIVDNSSENDDEIIDEVTARTKSRKDQVKFTTDGSKGVKEVTVTLHKDRGYAQVHYTLSADWSHAWQKLEEEAAETIHKANFIIYRGQL
jgi:hypothetical protein